MVSQSQQFSGWMKWFAERVPQIKSEFQPLSPAELTIFVGAVARIDALNLTEMQNWIGSIVERMGGKPLLWASVPQDHYLPVVGIHEARGVFFVHARNPDQTWLIESVDGSETLVVLPENAVYAELAFRTQQSRHKSAKEIFIDVLGEHRGHLKQAAVVTLVLNFLALLTSLYSMQVYDRVIPSQGVSTLFALTIGVLIAIALELVGKFARSAIFDDAVKHIDAQLSHKIFERLLRIRLDQYPPSVGTLSAQLRSYEMIRSFGMSATLYVLVDLPFALLFLTVIGLVGGITIATVPLLAFLIALAVGMRSKRVCDKHTEASQAASNRKLGLLVETIDGAESIKSSGSGWQFLGRWNALTRLAIDEDLHVRHYSEVTGYYAQAIQQISYVLLVATGAYLASTTNELTSGSIVACSILSGRVLSPVTMLPNLIVQWANAKTALRSLEAVFKLKQDNHEVEKAISPEHIRGHLRFENIEFSYPERPQILRIDKLEIPSGQKVAVVGGIGTGKSTFLKLAAGLYTPQRGRVLIDGLDLEQIGRAHLSQRIGYLPQDIRLFGGTLRENLFSGLVGLTEQRVLEVCQNTGLMQIVSSNSKGFDLRIAEGGGGLSGGQRQLVGLARLILANPDVWLLDEPTASMDQAYENQAIHALRAAMKPEQTMVLITHKPALLALVDRVIVMAPGGIAIDGSRDDVIQRLNQMQASAASAARSAA